MEANSRVGKPRQRKFHSKSRNGCLGCKKMHIKCDETRPFCMNCVSKSEICEYTARSGDDHSPHSPATPPIIKAGQAERERNLPLITPTLSLNDNTKTLDLSMDQLELLFTYMSTTCYHIASTGNAKSLQIWRDHVPRVGMQHKFLTHSILALSSRHLHTLYRGRSKKFDEMATLHYRESARLMALEMAHISDANAEPILLSSALALLLSYAMADLVPFVRGSSLELDIFALAKGPRHISVSFLDMLAQNGILHPLLSIENADLVAANPVSLPFMHELHRDIRRLASIDKISPQDEHCYLETAKCLEDWTMRAVLSLDETCLIVFPMFAWDSTFVDHLRNREPVAQIILAYYFGTLHSIHERFWVGRRPYNEILNIFMNLGEEWSDYLTWPLRVSGMDDFTIPMLAEV